MTPMRNHRPRALPLILLLLATLGCGEERERVRLAHFDFREVRTHEIYGPRLTETTGLHFVEGGWNRPKTEGIWTTDAPARVCFTTLGRQGELKILWSTNPQLAARGQTVTLRWDGRELLTKALPGQWKTDTLTVALPDDGLGEGTHCLTLETSDHLGEADGSRRPRGVYVRQLELSAALTEREQARWAQWSGPGAEDQGWGSLMLPVDPATAHQPQRQDFGPDQPDVLMILLDTVRADHVSSYGYARETTPYIDALAEGGVRFEEVLAEAPYTRSSVATIFTGASWRDHGVLSSQQSLAPSFTTLAEVLQEAGYQTLAISDNVNVARSAGSDQGFEEFVQTWSDVEREAPDRENDWWWPELPVDLFEERLAEGLDDDRPTFFYLHLMPPHEPYFPGPDHDLFSDPDYDGPIVGHTPDIQSFDRGEREAEGPDFQHLVDLYDGALHRGDALVGRALRAWEQRGTDRPTLIVLLSDHGEAFGEHGRFGHNSTPYDEMLHVPLILAPRERVPAEVREAAGVFRSVGDVLPLLLRSLDVPLPRGVAWPRTVLETLEDPTQPRREIFVRCTKPFFGLRGAQTLHVYESWSRQELYDLRTDPTAQQDLREVDTQAWLTGMLRIRGFLESGPASGAGMASELTDEDVVRLKALGYM